MADTVWPLAVDRRTVKTAFAPPLFPSVRVTSSIDRLGNGSSLLMVPTPCASAKVALVGLDRLTKKDSSASLSVSPAISTVTVRFVVPGGKLNTPLVAV